MAVPISGYSYHHNSQMCPHQKPNLLVSSIRPEKLFALHQVCGDTKEIITHGTGFPKYPTYSSDGEWLIFSSEKEGKTSLYVRRANDPKTEPCKLTNGTAFEGQAAVHHDTICFTSSAQGTLDIYRARFVPGQVIRMEDAVNLTKGKGSNFSPALSPDGKWLAFTSNRHATEAYQGPSPLDYYKAGGVYIMAADGSGEARMISSDKKAWQGGPSWAKDGRSLVFYGEEGENTRLYRYDMEKERALPIGPAEGKSLFPTHHPVTGHLVFAHQKKGEKKRWKIQQLDNEGHMTKLFSLKKQQYWAPAFKSDGSFAVNVRSPTKGPYIIDKAEHRDFHVTTARGYFPVKEGNHIYAVEAMSKVTLTTPEGTKDIFAPKPAVFGVSKSPKCDWLATTVGVPFKDGMVEKPFLPAHIYKVSLDGSAINLTEGLPGRNVWPAVSPDGRHIVFVHQEPEGKNKQLYIMDSDGRNVRSLTSGEGVLTQPGYSADGKQIVFTLTKDQRSYQVKVLHLNDDGSPGRIEEKTGSGHADTHPCIAPDNQTIAFFSDRGQFNEEFPYSRMFFGPQPYGDVYVLNHGNITRATDTPYEQSTPSWEHFCPEG